MNSTRRTFIQSGAAMSLGLGVSACTSSQPAPAPIAAAPAGDPHPAIAALTPMTAGVKPITAAERAARIEKARKLMVDNKISAIYLEGGSSMFYYTGVRWGNSERPFVCVIPAKGELGWVCPGFEEERARELVTGNAEVRVWQEDESPYRQIANILKDRGATGRVGVEERLRFFIYSGVKKEAAGVDFVDAEPITAGCRMIKSAAELALMQKASDITIEAFRAAFATFRAGIRTSRVVAIAFVLSGALAGFAGWLLASRTAGATANLGIGMLFQAFAAVVIGGVSLKGGQGRLSGVFAGVLLLSSIQTAINVMGMPPHYTQMIQGSLVLAAVLLDTFKTTVRRYWL